MYVFRKETHVYLLLSPVATAVQDYRSTVGHHVLLVRLALHTRKHTMAQCVSITYSTTRCMAAVFLSERFAPAMPGIGFQRGSPATIVRAFVDPPARDGTIHATGPPAHKGKVSLHVLHLIRGRKLPGGAYVHAIVANQEQHGAVWVVILIPNEMSNHEVESRTPPRRI